MESGKLTTKEVASLLRISEKTLIGWRVRRKGPPYQKFGGKVLYDATDLNRWVKANTITHTR